MNKFLKLSIILLAVLLALYAYIWALSYFIEPNRVEVSPDLPGLKSDTITIRQRTPWFSFNTVTYTRDFATGKESISTYKLFRRRGVPLLDYVPEKGISWISYKGYSIIQDSNRASTYKVSKSDSMGKMYPLPADNAFLKEALAEGEKLLKKTRIQFAPIIKKTLKKHNLDYE